MFERLLNMSLAKRRLFAFAASAALTLCIGAVWALTLTRTKSSVVAQQIEREGAGIIIEDQSASPFKTLYNVFRDIFDGSDYTYERR